MLTCIYCARIKQTRMLIQSIHSTTSRPLLQVQNLLYCTLGYSVYSALIVRRRLLPLEGVVRARGRADARAVLPAVPYGRVLPVRALPARRPRGDDHLSGRAGRSRARALCAPALDAARRVRARDRSGWRDARRRHVASSASRGPHVRHVLAD